MHALKSSLVLLASLAIVGCPSSDPVTPQPQPQPNPPPVLGPCDEADALRDGSQVVRWAKPYSEEALLAPDADGRVGAVVLFEDGQARAAALRDRGFKVTRELSVLNGVAVRATEAELAALANEPFVRHVQRDYAFRSGTLYRTPVPPPAFLAQAGPIIEEPSEITPGLITVQAPQVWDPTGSGTVDPAAPAGQGIKVCVLDSGVDRAHAEVMGFYGVGWDFVDGDDNPDDSKPLLSNSPLTSAGGGHGTHVAGTIGARYGHGGVTYNWMHEGGVVGVAPRAEILTGRVLDTEGGGLLSGVVAGIDWCVAQGSHIINMSLGSAGSDPAQEQAVAAANAAGVLVIAAAGNDELETPGAPNYPAALPGVMAVASVDADNKHSVFSQTGRHISVAAPGEWVLSSTIRSSGYYTRFYNGDEPDPAHMIASGSGSGEYEGEVVDCGLATSYESCSEAATCGGFVALVRRGQISFGEKVEFVRGQGAKMVVIYDPNPEEEDVPGLYTLGDNANFDIPVFTVSRTYGEHLLANVGTTVKAGVYLTDYAEFTGTSMATPHVAGVAAVVWSAQPDLTASQVRQVIECSATYLGSGAPPSSGKNRTTGHGLVQTQGALDLLATWNASGWPAADACE